MNEHEQLGTFERLVYSLESGERHDMLRQLAEISEQQQDATKPSKTVVDLDKDNSLSPEKRLLEEPFFVRLWFRLVAFLTSSSPSRAYSRYLVSVLGSRLGRTYGQFINPRQRLYVTAMHEALVSLDKVKAFFVALLASYENDKGSFYVVLASLMMEKTTGKLQSVSDPFKEPYDREPQRDIRAAILREIDVTLSAIAEDERLRMYQAAQAIEWMKSFCDISFDRMIMRFGILNGEERNCLIDSISEEMKHLANVLAGAGRIPLLMLEAMYLFSIQDQIDGSKFDLETECSQFVKRAAEFLSGIRLFKSTVPVTDCVRFTLNDVCWSPRPVEGGEDWFQLYKSAWRRQFDEKWSAWNRLHRKAMLEQRICSYLECESLPAIAYRPWEGMWLPLALKKELSFSFLKGFFSTVYAKKIMKPLKILLIEGDFYRRENLAEFTDAFSTLEHQEAMIQNLEIRLSPKGVTGEDFQIVRKEKMATVKGKARLENLMLGIEAEIAMMITKTVSAFRSIDLILAGVIGVVRGGPYETLVNMAAIQGKQNEKYRKELALVKSWLKNAIDIFSEIEIVEKEQQ